MPAETIDTSSSFYLWLLVAGALLTTMYPIATGLADSTSKIAVQKLADETGEFVNTVCNGKVTKVPLRLGWPERRLIDLSITQDTVKIRIGENRAEVRFNLSCKQNPVRLDYSNRALQGFGER